MVCDHKTAITISQDRSGAYDSEETIRNAFKLLIPQGMLSFPAGPEWKHHRRIMGPAMSNRYLSSMAHHVEACVDELLDLWRVKAELGGEGAWEAAEDLENATLVSVLGTVPVSRMTDNWMIRSEHHL